jgi:hypothetical protein
MVKLWFSGDGTGEEAVMENDGLLVEVQVW